MSVRAEGSPKGRSRAIRQEADERVPALRSDSGGRAMSVRAEARSFVLRQAVSEAEQ